MQITYPDLKRRLVDSLASLTPQRLVAKTGRDALKIVREAEKQLSRISACW